MHVWDQTPGILNHIKSNISTTLANFNFVYIILYYFRTIISLNLKLFIIYIYIYIYISGTDCDRTYAFVDCHGSRLTASLRHIG